MSSETRLNELLLHWEELREQGQATPSVQEFCADCPELRDELEEQIDALKRADAWMGQGGRAAVPALPAPASPGRYRPVRFHARGGLGEVFVAHDDELHREVALKRMHWARAYEAENRRRFLREAEITARLEHPGIVPVYGLVQDSAGQPSYAMRLIQGETLHEAIERFHQADRAPHCHPGERRLALRQLLNCLVTVCNTVAYAHSRGIVHRDLKPSNILLGAYGQTLVVDWGLAKQSAEGEEGGVPGQGAAGDRDVSAVTQIGQTMGTPAYMSPEQAAGQWDRVGPASDIYSLGATLYMLLTGQAPVQGARERNLLDQVQRASFPLPRQVRKGVPPALEAICLKAMALQPESRYATALALAADLEHWLGDEPVSVHPERWPSKARRWMKRHRALVTGFLALLLAAVGFLTILAVLNDRALQRTERERVRAKNNLHQALNAIDRMLARLGEPRLIDIPEFEDERRQILEEALGLCEQLLEENSTEPEARHMTGQAFLRKGAIYKFLGRHEQAEEAYRRSLALLRDLTAEYPPVPEYRQTLAASHNNLGELYLDASRSPQAEEAFRDALEIRQALAREQPTDPRSQADLAQSHHNLGGFYAFISRPREAEQAYAAALEIRQALARDHPTVPVYQADLAQTYCNLGVCYCNHHHLPEAEQVYKKGLAINRGLARDHPGASRYQTELARSYQNLALVYHVTGRLPEAEQALRDALAVQGALVHDHPTVPQYHALLAGIHNNLGLLYEEMEQRSQAEQALQEALRIRANLARNHLTIPRYQADLIHTYNRLAGVLRATGRLPEAETTFREGLAISADPQRHHPSYTPYQHELADGYHELGRLYAATGRFREAEKAYQEALTRYQSLVGKYPPPDGPAIHVGSVQSALGKLMRHDGQPKVALDWHTQAVTTLEQLLARQPGHEDILRALHRAYLGRLCALAQLGQHREAAAAAADVLAKAKDAEALFDAACVHAVCAAVVPDAPQLREQYAARAVALLREAVAKGFKDLEQLKDKDLDPLRSREDFQKLLLSGT